MRNLFALSSVQARGPADGTIMIWTVFYVFTFLCSVVGIIAPDRLVHFGNTGVDYPATFVSILSSDLAFFFICLLASMILYAWFWFIWSIKL